MGQVCDARAASADLFRGRGGAPGYEIHPAAPRPDSHPVAFVEPAASFEDDVLGLDLAAWPDSQAAMERARDSGQPTMSDRPAGLGAGSDFLIFVPVYRDGRVPPAEEGRRRSLTGFVVMAFRPDGMLRTLLGSALSERVSVAIYDAEPSSPGRLLYERDADAHPADPARELSATVPLGFGGRTWTLRLTTRPPFHSAPGRLVPYSVLGSGLLISVLAFVIASQIVSPTRRGR